LTRRRSSGDLILLTSLGCACLVTELERGRLPARRRMLIRHRDSFSFAPGVMLVLFLCTVSWILPLRRVAVDDMNMNISFDHVRSDKLRYLNTSTAQSGIIVRSSNHVID